MTWGVQVVRAVIEVESRCNKPGTYGIKGASDVNRGQEGVGPRMEKCDDSRFENGLVRYT